MNSFNRFISIWIALPDTRHEHATIALHLQSIIWSLTPLLHVQIMISKCSVTHGHGVMKPSHIFPLSISQALPRHVNTHHGLPLRIPRLQQADRAVRSAMGISFCTGSLEIVYYIVTWHGINTLHVGDSSTATLELTRSNF